MEQRSVFFEEWIKSLREQYKYVIRNNDQVTLPSLTKVLLDVGFGEGELANLRVEATMHIDDVGADYVPDMNILNTVAMGGAHPAECTCPDCVPIDESLFDDEGQPLTDIDPEKATTETGHLFPVADLEISPEASDDGLEDEPAQTFEDTLAEETEAIEEATDDEETLDDTEDDPDTPKQLSMF